MDLMGLGGANQKHEQASLSTNHTVKSEENHSTQSEPCRAYSAPSVYYSQNQQQQPTSSLSATGPIQTTTSQKKTTTTSSSNNATKLPPSLKAKEREEELIKNHKDLLEKQLPILSLKMKQDWKKISKSFDKEYGLRATPAFLKNYFKSLSSPNKGCYQKKVASFSAQDDQNLVRLISQYGLKWTQIAQELGCDDPIRLKNRYYHHIKKRGLDKVDEDESAIIVVNYDEQFNAQ